MLWGPYSIVILDPGSLTFLSEFYPRVRGNMDLEESRGRDDTEKVLIESGPWPVVPLEHIPT